MQTRNSKYKWERDDSNLRPHDVNVRGLLSDQSYLFGTMTLLRKEYVSQHFHFSHKWLDYEMLRLGAWQGDPSLLTSVKLICCGIWISTLWLCEWDFVSYNFKFHKYYLSLWFLLLQVYNSGWDFQRQNHKFISVLKLQCHGKLEIN